MILFAGYLLWAGAHRAGGAFQAAAVLAAAGVLLKLADMLPVRTTLGPASRSGLLGGLLLFFIVAAAVMPTAPQGSLLQYPHGWAGALILLIEAGLTLSLGLILARMFLLLADDIPSSDGEE
jgi:multisubunit Na+/H+ antiporter MnhB subunit